MHLEDISSAKIKISVEYYNEAHCSLLNDPRRYDSTFIERMNDIIDNGIEITGAEFLVNSLFHKKETKPGRYTHREILVNSIKKAIHLFDDDLEISHGSLRVQADTKPEAAVIMKRLGEAIGISVVSRIIGANEADWEVIPELNIKAFDFGYAVTDKGVVQIETKGSSSYDVNSKNGNIYGHSSNIKEKKEAMSENSGHPYRGDYNYGTISFSQVGGVNNLKCYLLDPPSEGFDINIQSAKLAKKLGFYHNVMSFISPKSTLLSMLWDRVIVLGESKVDIQALDELPYFSVLPDYESFFLNKTLLSIEGSKIWGDWFHYKRDYIVFVGVRNSLLSDVILQNVGDLLSNDFDVVSKALSMKLNIITPYQRKEYEKLTLEKGRYRPQKEITSLKAKGSVSLLKSGVAVGILKVIDEK